MFCTKCGRNNPDGAVFCSGCGSPMASQPNNAPQQTQAAPQQTPPKNNGSAGKVVLAVILTAIIIAGLAVGAYFLFLRDNDGDSKETGKSKVTDAVTDDDDGKADGDDEPSAGSDEGNADRAIDILNDAVKELHSYSSWSENCVMDYDMEYSGQTMSFKSQLMANVYDYDPDDPDDIRIEGSGYLSGAGNEQEWTYVYEDGEATYNYIKPTVTSTTVKMDPSIFNMDSLESDMINNVKISGETVSFTIDKDEAMNRLDMLESIMNANTGIEDLQYSDIKVKFTCDDDNGTVSSYEMEFSANIKVSGMSVKADYNVEYSFEVIE